MNKKLLLTSALVGSIAVAGSAIAETKISGDLEQTYASASRDLAANKQTGDQGYGSEANIAMSASKDIDLGTLKYGFKFEGDGDNSFDADEHFLEISNDALTFHFSRNSGSVNDLDGSVVPHVGDQNDTLATRAGTAAFNSSYIDYRGGAYTGVSTKVLGGQVSLAYGLGSTGTDSGTIAGGASSVNASYIGSLGVEGLKVMLGRSEAESATGGTARFNKMGASYSVGPVAIGVDHQDFDDGLGATASADNQTLRYGVTYNVSDDLSVGVNYSETQVGVADSANTTAVDEEITTFAVGYNLGGLGVKLYVSNIDNLAGTTGDDAQVIQFQTKQSF